MKPDIAARLRQALWVTAAVCALALAAQQHVPYLTLPYGLPGAVLVVVGLLNWRLALAAVVGWLVLGAAGLPLLPPWMAGVQVFSGSGLRVLAGMLVASAAMVGLAGWWPPWWDTLRGLFVLGLLACLLPIVVFVAIAELDALLGAAVDLGFLAGQLPPVMVAATAHGLAAAILYRAAFGVRTIWLLRAARS